MAVTSGLTELPLHRKIVGSAAVLLLVDLFLPWYDFDFGSYNGWRSTGTLAGLLLIALLTWEVVRLTGNGADMATRPDWVTAGLAGLAALFGLILFFDAVSDSAIGTWLGLVLLAALGYGAYLSFQAGGGMAVLQSPGSTAAGADRAPSATPPASDDAAEKPEVRGDPDTPQDER